MNGVPTQKSYNLHTESRAEAERKLNDLTALTRAREATDDELKAKVALTHAEFKRHRTALDAFETLSVRIDRLEQLIEQMISGGDK